MVNPATPMPNPTISLASDVSLGRPGTHGQQINTVTTVIAEVTIGFATSDQ